MKRVPVDCLILGQQEQHSAQAAEPQQQASCGRKDTRQHIQLFLSAIVAVLCCRDVFDLAIWILIVLLRV